MSKAADLIAKDAMKAAQLVKATAEQTATSINISYIQKDVLEIKQSLKEMVGVYVSTKDFEQHLVEYQDHEKRIRIIEESLWKMIGISSIIASIITVLGTFLLKLL